MLFGNKEEIALDINVQDSVDGWVFGVFLFWLNGIVVGEVEEKHVDLKGCVNWIRDFLNNPRNREEDDLFEMDKDRVFLLLCRSVILGNQDAQFVEDRYEEVFSRFHISHIGMTSFDDVHILLIENGLGCQRWIWQQGQSAVQDSYFDEEEVLSVMNDAVQWFDKKILGSE